jgi:hypothetical protein
MVPAVVTHHTPLVFRLAAPSLGPIMLPLRVEPPVLGRPQGGTHFHHPLLGGLTVQPRCGDALVFFPAFADGTLDHRMKHSGLAVKDGEKWICNTWVCQSSLPPGCSAASGLPQLPQEGASY